MIKIFRLLRTLVHLKPIQVIFQIYYRLLGPPVFKAVAENSGVDVLLNLNLPVRKRKLMVSFTPDAVSFTFLNQSKQFDVDSISWNYDGYGKLWTYHLNYFDFLGNCTKEEGIRLIELYMRKPESLRDGMEPYPTSLRIINWIRFSLQHQYAPKAFLLWLKADIKRLQGRLEYHLLANHLLENFISLWIASWYFQDHTLRRMAGRGLFLQLKEQYFKDGMHYERSPMYHAILMERLLDCLHIASGQQSDKNDTMVIGRIRKVVTSGMAKLNQLTVGELLPAFGDSVNSTYPQIASFEQEAIQLGIEQGSVTGSDSGILPLYQGSLTLFANYGKGSPSYQPGHAHADTFSFVLFNQQKPVIVDTGISTYQPGLKRNEERSTRMHNTIGLKGQDSSEVWGGFRVGRRARIHDLNIQQNAIRAWHDGYRYRGIKHERSIKVVAGGFEVEDNLNRLRGTFFSRLHFHPSIQPVWRNDRLFLTDQLMISFDGVVEWKLEEYDYAEDYNQTQKATVWVGEVDQSSSIRIQLIPSDQNN